MEKNKQFWFFGWSILTAIFVLMLILTNSLPNFLNPIQDIFVFLFYLFFLFLNCAIYRFLLFIRPTLTKNKYFLFISGIIIFYPAYHVLAFIFLLISMLTGLIVK